MTKMSFCGRRVGPSNGAAAGGHPRKGLLGNERRARSVLARVGLANTDGRRDVWYVGRSSVKRKTALDGVRLQDFLVARQRCDARQRKCAESLPKSNWGFAEVCGQSPNIKSP